MCATQSSSAGTFFAGTFSFDEGRKKIHSMDGLRFKSRVPPSPRDQKVIRPTDRNRKICRFKTTSRQESTACWVHFQKGATRETERFAIFWEERCHHFEKDSAWLDYCGIKSASPIVLTLLCEIQNKNVCNFYFGKVWSKSADLPFQNITSTRVQDSEKPQQSFFASIHYLSGREKMRYCFGVRIVS